MSNRLTSIVTTIRRELSAFTEKTTIDQHLGASIVVVLLLGLVTVFVVSGINALLIATSPGDGLRADVLVLNVLEHYLGLFCLLSAFYLQFSDRLGLPYTARNRPPWQAVAFFFLTGSSWTISSLRLFTRTRSTAVRYADFGVLVMTFVVIVSLVYVLSVYAPPEK